MAESTTTEARLAEVWRDSEELRTALVRQAADHRVAVDNLRVALETEAADVVHLQEAHKALRVAEAIRDLAMDLHESALVLATEIRNVVLGDDLIEPEPEDDEAEYVLHAWAREDAAEFAELPF